MKNGNSFLLMALCGLSGLDLNKPRKNPKINPAIKSVPIGIRNLKCSWCGHKNKKCTCRGN